MIGSGKVLYLKIPAGTNPGLSRAVGRPLQSRAWLQTSQSQLLPIVATQSISSLRAVFGQSEAWRALLPDLGGHLDVPLYTAAVEGSLDSHGYLVPGVGDMGDRLHGTT